MKYVAKYFMFFKHDLVDVVDADIVYIIKT